MAEKETPQMDWQQVVLNGGPPCFYVEGPQYCGRAERWEGHGNKAFHDYVSLDDLLNAERERALLDAARQECVFCAGADGYNSTPVQAALPVETDAGNYVHRNDPPHGLAGVYCKAPRIRALMTAAKGFEVKTNAD